MNSILLTIAIPTWNRAHLLDTALESLLPQVNTFRNEIEFIVSDNHSTDSTQEVIETHKKLYPTINFIPYLQAENTGYYGNFKKCRDLSNGRYLWILADDQFVNPLVVEKVIGVLHKNNNIAILHLQGSKTTHDDNIFSVIDINFNGLLKQAKHRITSNSLNIIINNKAHDNFIYERFNNSSFLCLIFLINTINYSPQACIVRGNIFTKGNSIYSFNFFNSFIEDLGACIQYMKELHFADDKSIQHLVSNLFKFVIGPHYEKYKLSGRLYNDVECDEIKIIEKKLKQYYSNFTGYNEYFLYRKVLPKHFLYLTSILRKLPNNLLKLIGLN